jgi:hypothetical protein
MDRLHFQLNLSVGVLMVYRLFTLLFLVPMTAGAQAFGSAAYCSQLAEIGANAYRTKKDGHPLEVVLQKVGYVIGNSDPQKKQAAQGVVIAVYGDRSIKSAQQAYDIVYKACKQ